MTYGGVAIFWLSVWVAYLLFRVVVLKQALLFTRAWNEKALRAVVEAYSAVPQVERVEPEDGILDADIIE